MKYKVIEKNKPTKTKAEQKMKELAEFLKSVWDLPIKTE